jgi:CRISPR-associated protein Csm1
MIELSPKRKARLLGSLLHDIGKFQYRAEKTVDRHEVNSGRFIRQHFARLEEVYPFLEDAISIAADHHNKYSDPYIKQADQMSAGERIGDDQPASHRPLLSIFSNIDIGRGAPPSDAFYYFPGPLNIDNESIFPIKKEIKLPKWLPDEKEMRAKHKPSWDSFNEELGKFPKDIRFDALIDTLYSLMEKWTSRVSSASYLYRPDISLFDHSRVVAAYTDCLAESDNKEKPFLVIEGDVSGIQNFIYRLARPSEGSQKKSAKTLRGRSLFVVLLTETIADYILKKLGLFKIHLLMNGGGHFHILAPNTKTVRDELNKIEKEINQWLLKEYKGDLGLILAVKAFSEVEVVDYGEVKREMSSLLTLKKSQKYLNLFGESDITGPFEPGLENLSSWDVCRMCDSDYPRNKDGICDTCKKHQKIGQLLPTTKYLLKVYAPQLPPKLYSKSISIRRNIHWIFLKDSDSLEQSIGDIQDAEHIEISSINNSNIFENTMLTAFKHYSKSGLTLNFRFIGKHTPTKSDYEVMEFEELAAETGEGYPMLQILRMDVDSLGKIFAFGIKDRPEEDQREGPRSIARVSNLSREMNLFFCGYLNEIAKDKKIYITYSGGDDLFVVGHWLNVIEFSQRVQNDFAKFTCHNPNLSISGGAVLVHPNFPIRRAAALAEIEEIRAKNNKRENVSKNSLSLFGEAYPWDRINELIDWGKGFDKLIERDYKYRNLARYLKELRDRYMPDDDKQDINWIFKVKHKIGYMLARRLNLNHKEIEKRKLILDDLDYKILGKLMHDPKLLQHISIPVIYALLKTRKEK